jgi:hypothetical protein
LLSTFASHLQSFCFFDSFDFQAKNACWPNDAARFPGSLASRFEFLKRADDVRLDPRHALAPIGARRNDLASLRKSGQSEAFGRWSFGALQMRVSIHCHFLNRDSPSKRRKGMGKSRRICPLSVITATQVVSR